MTRNLASVSSLGKVRFEEGVLWYLVEILRAANATGNSENRLWHRGEGSSVPKGVGPGDRVLEAQ